MIEKERHSVRRAFQQRSYDGRVQHFSDDDHVLVAHAERTGMFCMFNRPFLHVSVGFFC